MSHLCSSICQYWALESESQVEMPQDCNALLMASQLFLMFAIILSILNVFLSMLSVPID